MARPATARRPANHRASRLDRPVCRHVPFDPESPAAGSSGPAADGAPVPATPLRSAEEEPLAVVSPDSFWTLLPPADRERLGLRLSRLVLKAVRATNPDSEEDA